MTIKFFLIEKLWQDSMENRNAYGYEPIGVSHIYPENLVKKKTPKNGWPLIRDTKTYRITEIPYITIEDFDKLG